MAIEPLADVPDKPQTPEERKQQEKIEEKRHGHSPWVWLLFGLLLVVAAILIIVVGWLPRHKRQEETEKRAQAEQTEKPRVNVQEVRYAPSTTELMVPGTTLAYTQAYVYARASGYVTKRLVDIGDRVHAGQLLAVIDSPDLDKQVAQARSNLRQSESNLAQMEAQLHLAQVTWDRYKVLVAKGVFSRQDGDTQEANERVAEANVQATQNTIQANRDNLERLIVLQGYEKVTAPFSGIIIDRNVDVGALISAQGAGLAQASGAPTGGTSAAGAQANNEGSSGSVSSSTTPATGGAQGGEMFGIANIDVMRVLVSVPEAYTATIHVGQRATLFFQETPGDKIEARVARTSKSIDQNTRTLLVEVQVNNPHGRILPGMYVVVNFVDVKGQPPLLVPGEAIVVRNAQSTVALLHDNRIHFQPISIGRDYGDQTEVVGGLKAGDVIATVVTDEVHEGAEIDPQYPKQSPQAQRTSQGGIRGQTDKSPGDQGQYGEQGLSNQGGKAASGGKSGGKSGQRGGGKKQ